MSFGKVVNTTIMDNNTGDKDGKDGSKDSANDGDDDNGEDDDNDGEDDDNDDDKEEECNDGNGENDRMIDSSGLDKRVYSAIDTLKRKCEKANIKCSVLGLVVPTKVPTRNLRS